MPIPKKEDLPEQTVAETTAIVRDDKKADESNYQTKRERMAKFLAEQPKVRILVPLEGKEKQGVVRIDKDKSGFDRYTHVSGAVLPVQLNGYKIIIPKGEYVEVPQQVADVITNSQVETSRAGENFLIDRNEEVRKALG